MKIKGCIAKQDVAVLIDNGATHKFMSSIVIQELNVPLTDIVGGEWWS